MRYIGAAVHKQYTVFCVLTQYERVARQMLILIQRMLTRRERKGENGGNLSFLVSQTYPPVLERLRKALALVHARFS